MGNDTCTIQLKNGEISFVDKDQKTKLLKYKWRCASHRNTKYAISQERGKTIRMHRIIIGAKSGDIVDHINGNGLDNRLSNLRIVSSSENSINRRSRSKKSGYKGVTGSDNFWIVRIGSKEKHYTIGYYKTKEEAAIAYNIEAKRIYGEFAVLNTIKN